jgi:hypothetical protein
MKLTPLGINPFFDRTSTLLSFIRSEKNEFSKKEGRLLFLELKSKN